MPSMVLLFPRPTSPRSKKKSNLKSPAISSPAYSVQTQLSLRLANGLQRLVSNDPEAAKRLADVVDKMNAYHELQARWTEERAD
jgi:hypothetical protein